MTLRFEIFCRETANWQRRKQASLVREIHNCAESSGITACMWIQVCIGHSGVYRVHYGDVKGRLFVNYKSFLVLLWWVGQPLMVCRQEVSQLSKRCDGHK